MDKLETAIDELHYALTTGNEINRDHYIRNAIRFIEEYKEQQGKHHSECDHHETKIEKGIEYCNICGLIFDSE